MQVITMASALALIWKLVDFVKFATNKDKNSIITQLVTWAAGVGVISLFAHTSFAEGINIGSAALGHLNWASLVFVGLTISSTGSVAYDLKNALDNTGSSVTPSMVPTVPAIAVNPPDVLVITPPTSVPVGPSAP